MKKNVTFLINSLTSSGAEKVMSVLITELVRQSYNVELICLEKNNFYALPKEVKVTYLSQGSGEESGVQKLLAIPLLVWRLKQHIKGNNIALVQSHIYRSNYINVLAKLFGAGHQAQVVNAGRVSRYLEQGVLGKVNLFLIKHLYARADLIISKAEGMQADMQALFHFKNAKKIINNPYDIEKIQTMAQEEVTDFCFEADKTYLISVGRLIALKRNQDTMHTLSKLPEDVALLLLGEGEEREKLTALAKTLDIAKRVHFLGQVSNPYKYIFRADIFVSASESEGFPNVLVESMICGTPVISSDCVSGPREILAPESRVGKKLQNNIEQAPYGILFSVADTERLTEAITLLLQDETQKKSYTEKAKKRAEDFSVEKIVQQYKEIFKKINRQKDKHDGREKK